MENTQNNMPVYSSGDNKKTVLITVVGGIIVLGALVWWMRQTPAPQQVLVTPSPDAEAVEAATINQEIDSLNVGDLNAELDAIDKNLQGL